jgi:tetratricopeptide (TPR) repeat protein
MQLKVTNEEAALSDRQIDLHFASIDDYSLILDKDSGNLDARFGRSMDFMVVQNLSEAVLDLNKLISLYPDFILARFNRAVINYKILEIERFNNSVSTETNELSLNIQIGANRSLNQPQQVQKAVETDIKKTNNSYLYEQIIADYTEIIRLNPDFAFARFNRGNVYCTLKDYRSAIIDYNEAIAKNPYFSEAWFNRGLTRLFIGETELGIEDLSRAGELGIPEAYGIIKKMTAK